MLVLEQYFSSTLVLTLSGRFDQKNDMALETALLRGDERRVQHVVFNLEQISTITTAGIGRIYVTFFRLKHKGVCLSLINPKPSVREILDLVRFLKLCECLNQLKPRLRGRPRLHNFLPPLLQCLHRIGTLPQSQIFLKSRRGCINLRLRLQPSFKSSACFSMYICTDGGRKSPACCEFYIQNYRREVRLRVN